MPTEKWLGVLELGRDPQTGRRVRRTVTAATRREAVERLRQLRRDVEQGAVEADARTTVEQWARRWLEHVTYRRDVIGDLRPNTAGSYERLARIHVVGQRVELVAAHDVIHSRAGGAIAMLREHSEP